MSTLRYPRTRSRAGMCPGSWAVLVLTVLTTISCTDVDQTFNRPKSGDLPVQAYWREMNRYGDYSIHFSDQSRGWVVGPEGAVFATRDGGASWSPQFSGTDANLTAVCFVDSTRGWTVGAEGTMIATTDGGMTWRSQVSATDLDLESVYFRDATHGWVVGEKGVILATIDGGVTWSPQMSTIEEDISAIHFVSKKNGWAVGDGGTILATLDGGSTWKLRDSGINEDLNAVHFSSAIRGWAVGDGAVILATVDGGANWTRQAAHTDATLNDVCFLDDLQGWAVGANGTILTTTDGGTSWNHDLSSDTYTNLKSMTFLSSNRGWIVGRGGTILSSTERGAPWSVRKLNPPGNLRSISFPTDTHGWAVGGDMILATADGGVTWIHQEWPVAKAAELAVTHSGNLMADPYHGFSFQATAIYFVDEDHGWMTGKGGIIFATADGGTTWSRQSSGTRGTLLAVHFPTESHGWIAGAGGCILATVDGGTTWTQQPSPTFTTLRSVYFPDTIHGWAVGDGGTILFTHDGGVTWIQQRSESDSDLNVVFFLNAVQGWAAGNQETILGTGDGGASWILQETEGRGDFKDIHFIDADRGWAVGSLVSKSTIDGGATWNTNDFRVFENLSTIYEVLFINKTHGLILATNGGCSFLLSSTDGGATWTQPVPVGKREGVPEWVCKPGQYHLHFTSATKGRVIEPHQSWMTTDGGASWSLHSSSKRSPTFKLNSVYFTSDTHGWIVGQGGIILNTTNGGTSWDFQSSHTSETLWAVQFVDDLHGWIVGERGTVLATADGGNMWERQVSGVKVRLNSAYFLKGTRGWIVGEKGTILTTTDGGTHWNRQDSYTGVELHSVYFTNLNQGWAVGNDATILETSDGGSIWTQRSIGKFNLYSVRFANATDGVIAGHRTILSTADGGDNWVRERYGDGHSRISEVYFSDAQRWAVGSGTVVRGLYDVAPFVVSFLPNANHSLLTWTVEDDIEAGLVRCALEFRVGKGENWRKIGENLTPTATQGRHSHFELSWDPEEYRITPGKELHYRVILTDARHEGVIQEIDGSYCYQCFVKLVARRWNILGESSLGKTVRSGIILILLGGLYIGLLGLVLIVRPAWLLWLTRLPIKALFQEMGPTRWAGIVLEILVTLTLGRYFARHRRTRQAWAQSFHRNQTTLEELDPEIRRYYLDQADVLDAWVERHLARVRDAFLGRDTVLERRTHVPMPVQLSDKTLAQLTAGDLRNTFARRGCLLIWGDGGTGKTSLACQVAAWAMAEDPRQRLAPHRMLAVLLEPGFVFAAGEGEDPLREAIRGQLTDAAGLESPISPELLDRLLRHRRVLVILDSLSEMDDATRRAIEPARPEFAAHALVVTSRRQEDFRVRRTDLKPLVVKGTRLLSFFEAYFARSGKQHLFNDQEVFGACRRVARMVGTRVTTILFARLFADQMISARDASRELEFPDTLPDLILRYLNNLIAKVQREPRQIRALHAAAKTVAWECLRTNFRPSPAGIDHVLEALGDEEEGRLTLSVLEHRLGIVKTVQPAEDRIRFALDPLAEFLAGLHLVETLAAEEDAWRGLMDSVKKADGSPAMIREFLLALRDCCQAKGAEHGVPGWVVGVLDEILSPEMGVS